jgi:hypothetical protein
MTTPVLFLDEASVHSGLVTRLQAEKTANALLETLRSLRKLNKKFALNTATPIAHFRIADDWTLQSLLGGIGSREEWDFIRQLSSRSPINAEMEQRMLDEMSGIEACTTAGGVQSTALAWAFLLDSATVSCQGHTDWADPWVRTTFTSLDEDGALSESECSVRNASDIAHAGTHEDWFKKLGVSTVPSADTLWAERTERLPNLRFLARVQRDLSSLQETGAPFRQALAALDALQRDIENWMPGHAKPDYSTLTTPESNTRQRYCWAKDDLTNKSECFEMHKRFTGGLHGRVHFKIDELTRMAIVAYVGPKLFDNIPG